MRAAVLDSMKLHKKSKETIAKQVKQIRFNIATAQRQREAMQVFI